MLKNKYFWLQIWTNIFKTSATRVDGISPFGCFLHFFFTQMCSFKTWFIVLILTFRSSVMQLFSTFNLRFYNLATVLATFPKIGQFFFKLRVNLFKTSQNIGFYRNPLRQNDIRR